MYIINKEQNNLLKIKQKTFAELRFRERDHLQEWIAKNPCSLGEELLVIQKEFSGFSETNERLDLLALDKFGNLVIIENKLDDSGKDVTWQAIKYASYCSSLTKNDILKIYQDYLGTSGVAIEKVSEFFDNKDISEILLNQGQNSQRLILVAAHFRKEVTSSVLWLMNFNIRIQCFKVTPFSFDDKLLLSVEQILPIKDTEDFSISIATKAQEEIQLQETLKNRHKVRLKFWESFLNYSNSKSKLFNNNSPSKDNWIGKGIGCSGINLNVVASSSYCRVELYFNRGSKDENKEFFDFVANMRSRIEKDFGGELTFERMEDNVTCRIKSQLDGVSYFEESHWEGMFEFMLDSSERMERAFKEPIKKLNLYIKEVKSGSLRA